jgi:uracil-DNA glycosylase family 4
MQAMELDARQRAMLEEMGIRVWAPLESVTAEAAPLPEPQAGVRPGAASPESAVIPAAMPAAKSAGMSGEPPPGYAATPERSRSSEPVMAAAAGAAPVAPPRLEAGEIASLDWDDLTATVAACQACGLCKSRKNTVFGVGHKQARWLIVGEAPGENEDLQGEPFVGQAGKLLDNMLKALGRSRVTDDPARSVYIANVLKCRPPGNRNPALEEVLRCEPYLRRQVALLQPQIILAMGRFAAQSLLQHSLPEVATMPLGRLRGQVYQYEGVPVVVSYHPAYLLRTPQDKAKAWEDLCLAQSLVTGATVG